MRTSKNTAKYRKTIETITLFCLQTNISTFLHKLSNFWSEIEIPHAMVPQNNFDLLQKIIYLHGCTACLEKKTKHVVLCRYTFLLDLSPGEDPPMEINQTTKTNHQTTCTAPSDVKRFISMGARTF